MTSIDLHIDEYLTVDYLEEKLDSTNDITVNGNGNNYNEYYVSNKSQVFSPKETGEYTIEYNGSSITVNVIDPYNWVDNFDNSNLENWEKLRGDWIESNDKLVNTSGGNNEMIARDQESAYGYWEFEHKHQPQYYGAQVYFMSFGNASNSNTPDTAYYIQLRNSNAGYNRKLMRIVSGTSEELLDLGNYDGNWHTYRIERDRNNEFTVFVDGSEIGSVIDSEITESMEVVFQSDDSGHRWRSFEVSNL